jgi:RNA 3'-terminal phosphate cyclase
VRAKRYWGGECRAAAQSRSRSEAEQITQQAAQDFVNTLNPSDVVGSLLAHKLIEVVALDLAPVVDVVRIEELVEAAREQLNLEERVFG